MANLKHVFGGQQKDLVSPYVQVSFAGLTVSFWNLAKTQMYPTKLPCMQNVRSFHPLGAVLRHPLSENLDFSDVHFI